MIIVMKNKASLKEISTIFKEIKGLRYKVYLSKVKEKVLLGATGNGKKVSLDYFEA
ncbi:MAG: hypothetical protein ACE5GI_02400, partial [Candidatus Aminicenantales bacterium]